MQHIHTGAGIKKRIRAFLALILFLFYCSSSRLNTRVNRATVSIIPMTMK